MQEWLSARAVEIAAVLFSLAYLYFSIRQLILLWPMGIISALLYMVVFYQSKFYADMGLNGYYLIVSVYGWIHWSKAGKEGGSTLPVTRINGSTALLLGVLTLLGFFGIGFGLDRFTDSPIPYWDALTTAVSFAATWMLARKILEHWILWIFVDAISIGLYLYRGLYPTLVLFAVYTTMAIIGYLEWKKTINKEIENGAS
ncbi:MAG: nicotinamide riboside transporter PnuC [Bacteroidales bacterium]